MKYLIQYVICLLVIIVVSSSCIRDNCGGTVCNNEGVCVQGICTCPAGYEGGNCEKLWTDKFNGKWSAVDVNDSFSHSYDLNIISSLKDTFLILGMVDTLDTIYCVRKSYYEFDMTARVLADTTQKIASGVGIIDKGSTSVTGLYSFAFGDSVVATKFPWTR